MGIFKKRRSKALRQIDEKIQKTNDKVDKLAEKIDSILRDNSNKLVNPPTTVKKHRRTF